LKLERGATVGQKYVLEKRLAIGGMGSVWVARHAQLDVEIAIKFMDPNQAASPLARQRFEREAKSAASLHGPHVVHVQDYGVEGETPYLVMELLRGEDLGRRLSRKRRISLRAASRILTEAARGLRRAHELGIVHRDIKPGNIFLSKDDDREVVKILDFGIAKETFAMERVGESTRTGELMGSPHYMSPEQIRSAKDLDGRSDCWSLGVILFRAITGKLPFDADGLGGVIAKVLADPIPRPSEIAADVPPDVDAFFEKALARDRAARFQTAREMAESFARVIGEDPRAPLTSANDGATVARSSRPPPLPTTTSTTSTTATASTTTTASATSATPSTSASASAATEAGARSKGPPPLPPRPPRRIDHDATREPPADLATPASLFTPSRTSEPPSFPATPTPRSHASGPVTPPPGELPALFELTPAPTDSPSQGGAPFTGSPLLISQAPPAPPKKSRAAWFAVGAVVALAGTLGAALRMTVDESPPVTGAMVNATATSSAASVANVSPTSSPEPAAPTPPATTTSSASAEKTASAPSASASAKAAAPAAPAATAPASTPALLPTATPTVTKKKQPSWGF
jgi:serine/threonine-protein kinase